MRASELLATTHECSCGPKSWSRVSLSLDLKGKYSPEKTQFISPSLESVSKIMKLDATLN